MSKNKTTAALIAAASLLTLTGCGLAPQLSAASQLDAGSQLNEATSKCSIKGAIAADGKSATMRAGTEYIGAKYTIDQVGCLLSALSAPSSVGAHMDATRSIDGMQEDQWEGMKARWTYHPDKGLEITVYEAG